MERENEQDEKDEKAEKPAKKVMPPFTRFLWGHLGSWAPTAFAIFGSIPLILFGIGKKRLIYMQPEEIAKPIAYVSLGVGAVVFLIVHGVSLIWVLAKDEPRGRRRYWWIVGILSAVLALMTIAGWVWIIVLPHPADSRF